ncbi:glucose dehydrogenase [FAD, quinone] [Chironomus tepperi]|uniref:glucose dehydrogenase [FAD, quinone] n=1 Tax=Chironomus tepperi TaxID=113505 RepID=UPI00391F0B03
MNHAKLFHAMVIIGSAVNVFDLTSRFLSLGNYRYNHESRNREVLNKKYDFIVVGAGSAGCALAARLSENPEWNVLLIEAGANENLLMDVPMAVHFLQGYDINWGYKTEPSKTSCLAMNNNQCNWPRGKVMGGSSVLNYMVYTRGHPKDYDNWSSLGNEGWDFKNVSYYFRKLENNIVPNITPNYHGKNGPNTVSSINFKSQAARAFVAAGIESGYPYVDYNGPSQVGYSFLQASIENGLRKSTNAAYLHPIKFRRNLHVRKNSIVTKLLMDDNNNVYGVEFYTNKKYYKVNATKEVLLSAGALNSPQIMMLSGIGPSKHLKAVGITPKVNLAVGYNLIDHTAPGALTYVVNSTALNVQNILDLNIIDEYFNELDGPMSSAGGVESIAFLETEKSYDKDGYPDLEFLQLGGSVSADPVFKRNFGIRDDVYNEMFAGLERSETSTFMVFPMVMRPKSRGRIKLRSSNPFDAPVIMPNYFSDQYDVDISVRGIRKLIELSKTNALRKIDAKFLSTPVPGCKHLTYDSDEYWDCYTRHFTFTIYHHCGTAKMGPRSDKRAVVDSTLKVYGVKGLRVVDASIMPDIVTGHTNAPVIMIAEKAADLIKNEWNYN